MHRPLALCLVGAALLAGCWGPAATPTPVPPADAYDARAPEALPGDVNASLVYERVQRLLDVPARADVTVRRVDPADASDDAASGESFVEYMGAEPTEDGGGRGVTTNGTEVTLYATDGWSASLTESVLAHELVHALQHQHGVHGRLGEPRAVRMVDRAVIEGVATYVQREYASRYLDDSPRLVAPFNDSEPYRKLNYAQYSLGGRYVEARADDPAAVDRVYEDPPTTTEQLVHGYAPDEEPPRDLSVDVQADGYRVDRRSSRGELAVNAVLSTELDDGRAWHAAAGWGADELVRFRRLPGPEEEGYAWVLRWDAPAEAEEFRDALRTFLDRRGERADGRWIGPDHDYRVEPVGDETVVLLVGTGGFVEATAADGTSGDVAVEVTEERARADRSVAPPPVAPSSLATPSVVPQFVGPPPVTSPFVVPSDAGLPSPPR